MVLVKSTRGWFGEHQVEDEGNSQRYMERRLTIKRMNESR